MLIRSMIQYEVQDDPHIPCMCFAQKCCEILKCAILRCNVGVVRNIVSAVPIGGGEVRRKPDRIHTKIGKIFKFFEDALEIADAIGISISKRAWIDLIKDCSL